jgi:hypothetical protein
MKGLITSPHNIRKIKLTVTTGVLNRLLPSYTMYYYENSGTTLFQGENRTVTSGADNFPLVIYPQM